MHWQRLHSARSIAEKCNEAGNKADVQLAQQQTQRECAVGAKPSNKNQQLRSTGEVGATKSRLRVHAFH